MKRTLCIVVLALIVICLSSMDTNAGLRRGRMSRTQRYSQPAAVQTPAVASVPATPTQAEVKTEEVKTEKKEEVKTEEVKADEKAEVKSEEVKADEKVAGEKKHVTKKLITTEETKEPEKPQVSPEEMAAIQGLNAFRARCGLPPCILDLGLCKAARRHSQNMAAYNFFSHVTPWGETHGARGGNAENIYMGSSSGHAATNAWINSSGHRANMLGPYTRVGVGCFGGFFTQLFR